MTELNPRRHVPNDASGQSGSVAHPHSSKGPACFLHGTDELLPGLEAKIPQGVIGKCPISRPAHAIRQFHCGILPDPSGKADVERARKSYTELFGWKIERTPGPMECWMISTSEDPNVNAVNSGMMNRIPPEPGYRNYMAVSSVEDDAAKIKKLGGRVVVPKTAVSGFGCFAVCLDTENNCFAIWETDESAK